MIYDVKIQGDKRQLFNTHDYCHKFCTIIFIICSRFVEHTLLKFYITIEDI